MSGFRMKEGGRSVPDPRRRLRWNRSTPQVPLRVAADPLDALRGPVRCSGNRHRHPTHRGSGHHAAAYAATPRAPNTGSAARRSRHLDAEVREDPDHGLRSVSNAQPGPGSPSTGLLTGSTGKPAPLEFLYKSKCIWASFVFFPLLREQKWPRGSGLPRVDQLKSGISESKLLLSYFLLCWSSTFSVKPPPHKPGPWSRGLRSSGAEVRISAVRVDRAAASALSPPGAGAPDSPAPHR